MVDCTRNIIVNYHYVKDPSPDFSGIHPCPISEFRRQIGFLSSYFKIVTVGEVFESAARGNSGNKKCAITFDDCFKDQYKNAEPVLEKYGAVATFFPITATLEGRIPTAHKIHILLSRLCISELIAIFNDFIYKKWPGFVNRYHIPLERRLVMRRMHEETPTANFKEVFSVLPNDIRSDFLEGMFSVLNIDEKKVCDGMFMNKNELVSLRDKGHYIGGHTHNHYALDVLNEHGAGEDVLNGVDKLVNILKYRPNVFSYPHGRYNDTILKVVKNAGFDYGVTLERRYPNKQDNRLAIPRYDAIDLYSS